MIKIKSIIENLLKKFPELRDNDNRLIANVWSKQIEDIHSMSAHNFLKLFATNKVSTPETITRVRRKLQEDYIHYRGKKYKTRHKEAEVIRTKIKTL